jgi:predicted nucleic acid-binding protein
LAQVLLDTSAINALIDKDDSYHSQAVAILRSLPRHGLSSFLTNFIVAESHALLLSRLGAPTAGRLCNPPVKADAIHRALKKKK